MTPASRDEQPLDDAQPGSRQPPRSADPFGGLTPGRDQADADPDAQGLPPNVRLPDAAAFRKGQLWARLVVALVVLALLAVFMLLLPDDRLLVGSCMAVVALVAAIQWVRYMRHNAPQQS